MEQQVVLITGASNGFGFRTSLAMAHAGYFVVASMRSLAKSETLMAEADANDIENHITCVSMDVTNEEEVTLTVSDVIERFGKIDILVNNAGFAAGGFVEEVDLDTWRKQFETNFFGIVAVTKAVLPAMREQQSGTIINMSSISGKLPLPALGPYSASKFAVAGFSESLRLEMRPYGVHVVLVEPGSYQTAIWSKGLKAVKRNPGSPYQDKINRLMKMVSHTTKTAGDPEDVARLIVKIAGMKHPSLHYPIGKGVKGTIWLHKLLPWKWMERAILKRM